MNENFKLSMESELVPILDSLDRILSENIISRENIPGFNRSTVDGYAINIEDSHGASESLPSFLKIKGEVAMGEQTNAIIEPGEAIYVPTGGMIPRGANGVIMIEYVEKIDSETLLIYKSISEGENIVLKDDDISVNEKILKRGRKITPQDIGVLAALGISKVPVYKKPNFYIISTGDEIIDLEEQVEIGLIRDVNSYLLSSMIEKLGGNVVHRTIVRDDFDLLKSEVDKGIKSADLVLISGGSSVGTKDWTHKVIDSFTGPGVFIHGISIKPGKPTIVGSAENKIVVGLPGHPVSSLIVFKALIQHFIEEQLGVIPHNRKTKAVVDSNFPSSPGRTTYQMVSLKEVDGNMICSPNFGKSGLVTLLSKSSGYIIIDKDEEGVYKGEKRDVYFL